jgi:hypothetical protein
MQRIRIPSFAPALHRNTPGDRPLANLGPPCRRIYGPDCSDGDSESYGFFLYPLPLSSAEAGLKRLGLPFLRLD